jgi:hypothetical protein
MINKIGLVQKYKSKREENSNWSLNFFFAFFALSQASTHGNFWINEENSQRTERESGSFFNEDYEIFYF